MGVDASCEVLEENGTLSLSRLSSGGYEASVVGGSPPFLNFGDAVTMEDRGDSVHLENGPLSAYPLSFDIEKQTGVVQKFTYSWAALSLPLNNGYAIRATGLPECSPQDAGAAANLPEPAFPTDCTSHGVTKPNCQWRFEDSFRHTTTCSDVTDPACTGTESPPGIETVCCPPSNLP